MATCINSINVAKRLSKLSHFQVVFHTQSLRCYSPKILPKHLLMRGPLSLCKRYCSSGEKKPPLPTLTDFPIYVWPNFFNSFRNMIYSKLIIRPYFDENFDLDKFVEGSKQAMEVVSHHLSENNFDALSDLLEPELLNEIKQNMKNFSLKRRMELAIDKGDIYACYVHNIGIIMPGNFSVRREFPKERFVEITMTFHVLKGFKEMRSAQMSTLKAFTSPEFEKQLYVLTYRFIRDYSEGKQSHWVINKLNHLKPMQDL